MEPLLAEATARERRGPHGDFVLRYDDPALCHQQGQLSAELRGRGAAHEWERVRPGRLLELFAWR